MKRKIPKPSTTRLMVKRLIRIGARKSALSIRQSKWVKDRLVELHPGIEVELVKITTRGDKILDSPLAVIGGKGLFVKEIEEALTEARADIAVHSMKDMPAELPAGLIIGAVPKREDPFDALVGKGDTLAQLRQGARVGTSSLRRRAQLKYLRPDLTIEPLRGNVDTRLRKLDEGKYDAIVLAVAGLVRMGLDNRVVEHLCPPDFLPAVGQGALALEIREDDDLTRELIAPIEDTTTRAVTSAERAFLAELQGGCQVPIAAYASVDGDSMHLAGMVADIDGSIMIKDDIEGKPQEAENLGRELARRLLDAGAAQILDEIYGNKEK